jgi:hypothetical protein
MPLRISPKLKTLAQIRIGRSQPCGNIPIGGATAFEFRQNVGVEKEPCHNLSSCQPGADSLFAARFAVPNRQTGIREGSRRDSCGAFGEVQPPESHDASHTTALTPSTINSSNDWKWPRRISSCTKLFGLRFEFHHY